jgi:hypothetical protein
MHRFTDHRRPRIRGASIGGAFAILVLTSLGGCAGLPVGYDFDPEADFSGLRSYAWIDEPREPTGDPRIDGNTLLASRIRQAVDRVMLSRGYSKADADSADFLLAFHVTLDTRTSARTLNRFYGYGPGWAWTYGYHYAPLGWSETYVYEYDEGTLILDVVVPRDRRLIWRGSGTDELSLQSTPEQRQSVLDRVAEAVLVNFPPPERRVAAPGG